MKRIVLTSFLLLTTIAAALADEITFVANAPKSVVAGKRFSITFEINNKTDGQPSIPDIDGLRILSGPNYSTFTSRQNVNGRVTTRQTITFTYIVIADNEGEIEIPAASISVDGKKYTSNPLTIKVLPQDKTQNTSRQTTSSASSRSSSTDISADDLFVLASLSKTKVYEQEAVLLTYKVYSNVNLVNLDNPVPDLHGFNIQEVQLPQERQFELDRYNERNYNSLVWRQFVLFPQQTGKIEIPAMNFEAVVAVQTRRTLDPFEIMFNGGYSYVEVKKKLKSNSLVLDVKELPADKPAEYSGAVGRFTISSNISTTQLKSNEEFTLKVSVKGEGNMKLMGDPVINFPSEFDAYDPIINNNFKLTKRGFAGEKVYEYIITPRTAGTFELPAAQFTYLDSSTGTYKTIESQPYKLTVEKGSTTSSQQGGIYVVKEEGKILANDIRHIKLGDNDNESTGSLYSSPLYELYYIVPFAIFLLCVLIWRKRIADNANVMRVKTKKANSVAVRRLKNAKQLMRNNKSNEFYDELLKAVWGYMSDKLSIPLSRLSKDNIASELSAKGIESVAISELNNLLNECEFARYAPGDAGTMMDQLYNKAIDLISKMENSIKR